MDIRFFKATAALLFILSTSSLFAQQVKAGKVVYEKHCLSCHQADGGGVPGMNPPLSRVDWVTGDKTRLILVVLKGLDTPLEIDDEVYHNIMPSHAFLADQQIADVLTYIRSNFGNSATVVTLKEVETARIVNKNKVKSK